MREVDVETWAGAGYAAVAVGTLIHLVWSMWRDHRDPELECLPVPVEAGWAVLAAAVWPFYWAVRWAESKTDPADY